VTTSCRRSVSDQLGAVSRTFGLTVGVLDREQRHAVSLAYLLLRALDTCEDAHNVPTPRRILAIEAIRSGLACGAADRAALAPVAAVASAAERRLLDRLDDLLAEVRDLPAPQREAIGACAGVMADGMAGFLARRDAAGGVLALDRRDDLLAYCYVVAGVVGEMLDRLYGPAAADPERGPSAVDLGTGLQLVNIVRDLRTDTGTGTFYDCWRADDAPAAAPSRPLQELAVARLVDGGRYLRSISEGDVSYLRFCFLNWQLSAVYLARLLAGRRVRGRRYRARVIYQYHNSGVVVRSRRLLRRRVDALSHALQAALDRRPAGPSAAG